MKPKHIKAQRQQEVRRIWKRIYEVSREQRALGYITLEKPIRHGWFKEIVVRQRVERYKNEAAILELLDMVEKSVWGKTKSDAEKTWQKQTSKYLIYKDFPTISKKQFNKLSVKAQYLCTPFHYRNSEKKLRLRFYIRIPKGAYRIKYTRAYITHLKRIDPQLESESALLTQQLLKNGYYEANEQRHQWKDYWRLPNRKKEKQQTERVLRKLRDYPIKDILEEIPTFV